MEIKHTEADYKLLEKTYDQRIIELTKIKSSLEKWQFIAFILGILFLFSTGSSVNSGVEEKPDCEPTAYVIC